MHSSVGRPIPTHLAYLPVPLADAPNHEHQRIATQSIWAQQHRPFMVVHQEQAQQKQYHGFVVLSKLLTALPNQTAHGQ
jgi:hypothetical protein